MTKILKVIAGFIIAVISMLGYPGVAVLMVIESACIPLPSEIIMPFSGYLVSQGHFNLWLTALSGAIGNVLGGLIGYWMGMVGGKPLINKFGKYVLMSNKDVETAERVFQRYGDPAIFFSRIMPVIRTFISFPAGISKMNIPRFIIYTFMGSYIWCLGLSYLGMRAGQNWEMLKVYFHKFDALILAVIVIAIVLRIHSHFKTLKMEKQEAKLYENKG